MNRYVIIGFIVAVVIAVLLGYHVGCRHGHGEERTDTCYVESSYASPKPIREKEIGVVRLPMAVFPRGGDNGGVNGGDSSHALSVVKSIADSVEIPLTQKEYRDSNYVAWVSGYEPKLDSLHVVSRIERIENTRFRRWNIGLTGGYGVGLMSGRLEPYIGIGITINLLK